MVLTKLFTPYFVPGDIAKPLTDLFGVLSVCVYFDYPPATYVLPTFYAVELIFAYLYAMAMIFRAWVSKAEGKIHQWEFLVFTSAIVYFALSMSFFSTIFAVQPDLENPDTISVHTVPYTNLMIALAVLQIAVTWYGFKVSWAQMNMPSWLYCVSYNMVGGIIFTTTVKLFCHINAMTGLGTPGEGSMSVSYTHLTLPTNREV